MQIVRDLHYHSKPFDIPSHNKFVSLLAGILAYDSGAELPEWKIDDYVTPSNVNIGITHSAIPIPISHTTAINNPSSVTQPIPVLTSPNMTSVPMNPSSVPFTPSVNHMTTVPTIANTSKDVPTIANTSKEFDIAGMLNLINSAINGNKAVTSIMSSVPANLSASLPPISTNVTTNTGVTSTPSVNDPLLLSSAPITQPVTNPLSPTTTPVTSPIFTPVNPPVTVPVQSFRSHAILPKPTLAPSHNTDI
jgi:hypothetical protein